MPIEAPALDLYCSIPFIKRTKLDAYSKTCVKRPLSKRLKTDFQNQLSLNAGQMYCRMLQGECSKGIILQYGRSSLSYHLSLRSLFSLLLSGRLTQVLLYIGY